MSLTSEDFVDQRRRLIKQAYSHNSQKALSMGHDVSVDVERFDVPMDEISFDADEYPYLKLALLETYLECGARP